MVRVLFHVLLYLASINAQQRTDNTARHRFYPCQSVNACATDYVHKKSFHNIVGMMSDGYDIRSMLDTNLLKPTVTELACRHFYRQLMLCCVLFCLEMNNFQRHRKLRAQRLHKRLVAVRLVATKMEIAMRRHTIETRRHKNTQQHDTVGSATHSDNNP